MGWNHAFPNFHALIRAILIIDFGLLAFNILPIYPLDGGQILRSLLWFPLGRARSLMAATVIGMVGIIGFVGLAIWLRSPWLVVLSAFMLLNCWGGLKHAKALAKVAKIPRRGGFACPRCKGQPPLGAFWKCPKCQQPFDTFQSGATCPSCGANFSTTQCLDCGAKYPISEWSVANVAPVGL